ncbi:hypothetical protein B9Z55_003356 [Caenorhabditis nigoni]|uniref:DUF7154 domain-containing protein n=1 Tax=Caenorhabditis nigoni TaxID=1611254 RepID=A0A2G5VPS4_9PELO|nr:hypothetical protein B9Z55_003356 [Caenorhabditis nigoni]
MIAQCKFIVKIGDYSLDGFCDPYQQKWQVDTGNGIEQYKELKGVCVLKREYTNHVLPIKLKVQAKVECLPTDPATYLFAYSNDLVYSDIESAMYVLDNTIADFPTRFVQAATVRFDMKTKEDFVFHEGDTLADSYRNSREHMKKQQVDPSQRFESSETGSDVLDMLERFVNTNRPNICGSFALIYMKRSPNEVEISKIVEKLRIYHIQFSIAAVHPSSGGLHPETLYDLAAKTNGFCTFSNDEYALFVNPHVIWPNLYYALNLKVSGTGKMNLPPITFPKQLYMMPLLVVGVQRTATAESFQSLTISSYDTQSGEIVPITVTKEQLKPTQDNSFNSFRGWFFMSGFPTTYNITLEYSYAMEDIIQIRITSTTPNDHWLPYQDV